MLRDVVIIDEELCDGCGQCVPACHEGALAIVNGKARLVADRLCDGLGACLGHCPRGAIKIEKREADAFDEAAVGAHLARQQPPQLDHAGGCPGSRLMQFSRHTTAGAVPPSTTTQPSELTHWPVQLGLLSPAAPVLRGAALLVAADCVPVAYADFHAKLLRGRAVVIGCPKFDDLDAYVERLTQMIAHAGLREILVARMEVPCCRGLVATVMEARRRAGRDIAVTELVVGTQGEIIARQELSPASAGAV